MTEEPEFLTLEEILEIHRDQIDRYGGDEGIRDRGLLESAVAMPRQSFSGNYAARTATTGIPVSKWIVTRWGRRILNVLADAFVRACH